VVSVKLPFVFGVSPPVDTKALINTAKRVSAESYVARFRAMNIAGWAFLLRKQSAEWRQAHAGDHLLHSDKR
jgi:hypothetical protein